MNVLVTGGAGYVGTELVLKLAENPIVSKVIVYDNLSRENYNLFINATKQIRTDKIQFEFGDLLDTRKIKKVLKDIDVVYHLAARASTPFANNDSHLFEQVNHWGTAELVYAIEELKTVKKLIYVSSCSVYGSGKEMIDENTVVNPKTIYGISKMRGEEHVARLGSKMNAIIIRLGNIYGYSASMRFDAVINKFMFESHYKNRISIHGNGRQSRSFIHVDKAVDSLQAILTKDIPSDIYNLTERNLEIYDLIDEVKDLYPSLEFIFINQHLELREQKVNPETKLLKYIPLQLTNFTEELAAFKTKFTFQSSK
ncbi:NAD(P)-dependent oxidoreductase [uncultured Cytophaga sp.]|uniref:NAD-dependent epimerase/dehydratase family protein n=1 Tax=uncultured Cytophaga sp. TaxID=160238 RepID=UPI0026121485|nr:NAD-dependent epimerase/dehydratase family protein [uncultured Cytophaga sp.]